MATLSGVVPGLAALGAGIPLRFNGERQGLGGVQSALSRQIKEQSDLSKLADEHTSASLAGAPAGFTKPNQQPFNPVVQSRLSALAAAMPGQAGVRRPTGALLNSRMSPALTRARMDASDNATIASAKGAEEERSRQLGELDFRRRMVGDMAKGREKIYQQEQDTRSMRGIAERNIGGTLQDIGRQLIASGGII